MKSVRWMVLSFAAVAFVNIALFAIPALAETGSSSDSNGSSPNRPQGGYDRRADRNHDGAVDANEQKRKDEIMTQRRQRLQDTGDSNSQSDNISSTSGQQGNDSADTNHDGKVDDFEKYQARNKSKRAADTNQDGKVDGYERKQAMQGGSENNNNALSQGGPGASPDRGGVGRRDNDNNPPGMAGGPGTNWENPPGSQGGPGTGPDRGGMGRPDNDNNPPGMAGGPGTNWENRPGLQGGPGSSPDRGSMGRRDNDNNPPGMAGGPGTNWENRPGPQGGPGSSPDQGANL